MKTIAIRMVKTAAQSYMAAWAVYDSGWSGLISADPAKAALCGAVLALLMNLSELKE